MRKLFTVLMAVILATGIFLTQRTSAQAPSSMSYQAVIRDADNILVVNHSVGMRISILQGSATGIIAYQEVYNPNPHTNDNGLLTIEIGNGIPEIDYFPAIDWANGPYYIKTECDPAGGTNYTITGTSQLLSIPYAFMLKQLKH